MNYQKSASVLTMILVAVLLISLGSAPVAAAAAKADPRIAKAIQEGELSWLDSIVVPASAAKLTNAFKKKYGLPDSFKVKHQRQGTGNIATLISQELQANRVTADVFSLFSPRFFKDLMAAGAIAKHTSPDDKYYLPVNEKAGLDYEPGYFVCPSAYVFAPVVNPRHYKKEIVSWNDLLDPALSGGKIDLVNADTSESALYTYYGIRQVMPLSFAKALAGQKPIYSESSVDRTQKLTRGETLVAITSAFRMYQNEMRTGVALNGYFPKEGLALFGQPLAIMAKAPHPNAASLFVDFLLSEEGHRLHVDLEAVMSARQGFQAPAKIKKYSPPISEINAIPINWSKVSDEAMKASRNEFIQLFK